MKGCQQLNVILEIINDKLEEGVAEQSDKCSGTREAIIYLRVWKKYRIPTNIYIPTCLHVS